MAQLNTKFYDSFIGGENNTSAPDNMHDYELRKCQNAVVNYRGGFKTRAGCSKINAISYADDVDQSITWRLANGDHKTLNMINNNLCEMNESTGANTIKIALQRSYIGYIVYVNMLYFVDGDKYYVWGDFDSYTQNASGDITIDVPADFIVCNLPASTGGGTAGHFYKSKSALGSINLHNEDYSNTTNWDDVTDVVGLMSNVIREVVPTDESDNDLEPIKKCKILAYHPYSYRVFATGNEDDPTAIYFMEVGDPRYRKNTSAMYPTTAIGPVITLAPFNQSMMVGYQYGWAVWDGVAVGTDAKWKMLAIPNGVSAHDTVCLTPLSLTFQSLDGHIYSVDSAIVNADTVAVLEGTYIHNITKEKQDETIKEMVNIGNNKAIFFNNQYLLAYSNNAEEGNNRVLVIDWDTKAPRNDAGWKVNCWNKRDDNTLLFGSTNYLLKAFDGLNDIDVSNGQEKSIHVIIWTKPWSLGTEDFKFIQYLYIAAQQSELSEDANIANINVLCDYENNSGSFSTDMNESFVWGRSWGKIWGFNYIINKWKDISMLGTRIQVTIESNSLNNPLSIYRFGYGFENRGLIFGNPM